MRLMARPSRMRRLPHGAGVQARRLQQQHSVAIACHCGACQHKHKIVYCSACIWLEMGFQRLHGTQTMRTC